MEQRRADRIAEAIENQIFDGVFSDGERLDEVRLSEQYGVSRTPLREAFQRLALSGLVELIPRRGAFVRQPGPIELMEMFEVMAELEAMCGRLAAMRISDKALAELSAANAACQSAVDAQQAEAYYIENEKFHRIIYRQSGNMFLEQEANKLHKRLRPFRRQQLKFRGRMAASMVEHEAVLSALRKNDVDAAAHALRDHVAIQGEKFYALMSGLRKTSE